MDLYRYGSRIRIFKMMRSGINAHLDQQTLVKHNGNFFIRRTGRVRYVTVPTYILFVSDDYRVSILLVCLF